MLKLRIRKEISKKLHQQNNVQRLRKSQIIQDRLFTLAEFKKANYVMFYMATEEEVQTQKMILQAQKIGKQILVPVIFKGDKTIKVSLVENIDRDLSQGPYGIMQPKPECIREVPIGKIDLVVVPGVAFDKHGNRLGRGGGYYDRFLAGLSPQVKRIGLAFDFQLLKELPVVSHDIPVTKVISA